jgi:spore coat protein U-like protein
MLTNALKLAVAGTLVMATVAAVAAPSPATTTLNVSAYDASAAVNGSADLSVRCSNATLYTIKLGGGLHGNIGQRLLRSAGGSVLEYNLFTNAARGTVWGDTIGTNTVGGSGRGMSINNANTHTVFGTIANSVANQDVPVGLYTDAVAVTVEY